PARPHGERGLGSAPGVLRRPARQAHRAHPQGPGHPRRDPRPVHGGGAGGVRQSPRGHLRGHPAGPDAAAGCPGEIRAGQQGAGGRMKPWKWLVLIAATAAGLGAVALYSHYETLYPSTDNAYVDATAIRISTQIDGPVEAVPVRSQQAVKRGDVLLHIDATPHRAAARQAEAELALARRQVAENRAELASAEADLEDARVHLDNARDQLARLRTLKRQSYSSAQQTEDAQATFERARATLRVREAQREKARARLTNGESPDDLLVLAAQAHLDQARWSLARTQVSAPCDGTLESVAVHAGETVKAHQPAMVLVCTDRFWIEANFKETQLARIRPGQPVDIALDMYPGESFAGVVESISPASGTAFSLLPPENATGNWVKTTQRIPVKIRVTENPGRHPLRVGASSAVSIDTRGVSGDS